MKLARLPNEPSALIDFFQDGLESLGAVCERTWHDRLQLVAEGASARLWKPDGALFETELHFIAPGDPAPRDAEREVFPGCPLTFRLAEELRPRPLSIERGVLQAFDALKPPGTDVAEKLWSAQFPGCSRWKIQGMLRSDWHFSLVSLLRCEVQAIAQHWTLHRLGISLPDGQLDDSLAQKLDFAQLAEPAKGLPWPPAQLQAWQKLLQRGIEEELQPDLAEIRDHQQKHLRRELERIDTYFEGYENELLERQRRSHVDGSRLKAQERLAAAKSEHARRREDQIRRHEIRVLIYMEALMLLAEPAWQAQLSFVYKGQDKVVSATLIPRSRRWCVEPGAVGE